MEAIVVHDLRARAERAEEHRDPHDVRERERAQHQVAPRARPRVEAERREHEQAHAAQQPLAGERRDLGVPRRARRAEQQRRLLRGHPARSREPRLRVRAEPRGQIRALVTGLPRARPAPARAARRLAGRREARRQVRVGHDRRRAARADHLGKLRGLEARVHRHGESARAHQREDVEHDVDAVGDGDRDARAAGVAERVVRRGEAGHVVLEVEVRSQRAGGQARRLRAGAGNVTGVTGVTDRRGDRGAIPVRRREHRGETAQVHPVPHDELRLAAEPLDPPPEPLDVHRRRREPTAPRARQPRPDRPSPTTGRPRPTPPAPPPPCPEPPART